MFETTGHWVSSAESRPGTSLAEINKTLRKRLQGLKGRDCQSRGKSRQGDQAARCRLTPLIKQKSGPEPLPTRSVTPAGHTLVSRPGSQSLPSLSTWTLDENPFVAPHCDHELLVQEFGRPQPVHRSRSRLPRSTVSPQDFMILQDPDDEEAVAPLAEEPFVDDYLERIFPTNYSRCTFSPVNSKVLPVPQGSRVSSAHTVASSRHQGGDVKAQLKGKRQRLLERFSTTKRAFDDFLRTIRELKKLRCYRGNLMDVELPRAKFCNFLSQHFSDMPPEEHEMIFSFFDTDGSGSVSLTEFYAVVEAMSPVRCLADLRCRWIALGLSACGAMETMASRTSWATKRYGCQQFGQLLTKVGIWDWEEHVYIFTAVATPNLVTTISLAELHAALASVSPVLLIEEWQHKLEVMFGGMDGAYDVLEGDIKAPLDLSKFVLKAGEMWNMSSHEAKRFFRLCDFDAKEKLTRTKFYWVLDLVRPSLRLEHIRKKLRSHCSKLLAKIRSVNRQASMESLVQRILNGFIQHKEQPTRRRSRVPEDYQRMFDELQLTDQDMTTLFSLLDPRHPEKPERNCFWHMLQNFAPSIVLEDLCILSIRICQTVAKEVKEAQKLPVWQARQLGLARSFTKELKTWSDVVDGSRVFDVFSGLVPGQAARAAAARREATLIAPMAALSCCTTGANMLEDDAARLQRIGEPQLKQVLQEVFFERTEVQVKASVLFELLEDSQGERHAPRGLSIAEFLAAVGSMGSDGPPVDTTPEGREARAQMEARSQFEPFTNYAVHLRSAVRQKVSSGVMPKSLVTGNLSEPLSYVNPSSVVEVPVPEKRNDRDSERINPWEAMNQKLETVKLVKDQALREMLQRDICMEEADVTVESAVAPTPVVVVKCEPGAAEFQSFYHHMEETPQYVQDEELVERMRGYFHQAGGVVENQTALLSKKQNINKGHKSLKRAMSLKRSIKAETRTAKDLTVGT